MDYKKITKNYLKNHPYPNGLDELTEFACFIASKSECYE